jgi:hypothetical protein
VEKLTQRKVERRDEKQTAKIDSLITIEAVREQSLFGRLG